MSTSVYPMIPGVHAAGHVSRGFWHPGKIDGCPKCEDPPHYECPKCHRKSYNPNDIKAKHCGACRTFGEPSA